MAFEPGAERPRAHPASVLQARLLHAVTWRAVSSQPANLAGRAGPTPLDSGFSAASRPPRAISASA